MVLDEMALRSRYVLYAIKNPMRVVDFIQRGRKLSKLMRISISEIRGYLEELARSKTYEQICDEARGSCKPHLGGMLTPLRGPVLYSIIRALRPEVFVETGVSSGVSSTLILLAMEMNGGGALYSIDLPSQDFPPQKSTGWLVPQQLRHRWILILGNVKEELEPLLDQIGIMDGFLHDSEHTYDTMMFEMLAAWSHIKQGGILSVDDIATNMAFKDFVKKTKPAYVDTIGDFGVMRK